MPHLSCPQTNGMLLFRLWRNDHRRFWNVHDSQLPRVVPEQRRVHLDVARFWRIPRSSCRHNFPRGRQRRRRILCERHRHAAGARHEQWRRTATFVLWCNRADEPGYLSQLAATQLHQQCCDIWSRNQRAVLLRFVTSSHYI